MRFFIKKGAKDKLTSITEGGGRFQTVEVLATSDFEQLIPETERSDWYEIYPSWYYETIKVSVMEIGALIGAVMDLPHGSMDMLGNVWNQLMTIREKIDEAAGVTKEMLPNGMIKITNKTGISITREPYPYETEGN
jgi:hypothetical protein